MSAPSMHVAALTTTPVKGLRVSARRRVALERGGIRGDRRFFLVDDLGRMVNGKHLGALLTVVADLDDDEKRLTLRFPGGERLSGAIERGPELRTRFFSDTRQARIVLGPLSAALSECAGQSLRLVEAADGSPAVDRGDRGAVTLISSGSLTSLARAAGQAAIDARRFRMSIEITGTAAHAEDAWIGRELALGGARVLCRGHVGRCIVTSRDPDSGVVDLPTLDLLRDYRDGSETTEPLAFGIYCSVLAEGIVEVGDPVELA